MQSAELADVASLELDFQRQGEGFMRRLKNEHKKPMVYWNSNDWDAWDVAQIYVRGGNGGRGCKSFHREKNNEWMGPDGGDGGNGGHVILEGAEDSTLSQLKGHNTRHFKGEDGENGKGDSEHGKNGVDNIVKLPVGSVIWVKEQWKEGYEAHQHAGKEELTTNEDIRDRIFVGEITEVGQQIQIARGGKGGRGNQSFQRKWQNEPWLYEIGEKGKGRFIDIELKMKSDVGIIGVPNAGKSSLLSAVTNKGVKIAAYPFSTTRPNVAMHVNDVHGGLLLCDVPGLIEGAHDGRGMGITFLRHIERCRTLLHVIDGNSEDPIGDYLAVQHELGRYSTELLRKPQVIVVNKCDIPEVKELLPELMAELRKRSNHSRVFDISVATRYHVDDLMKKVVKWHKSIIAKDFKPTPGVSSEEALLVMNERRLLQLGGKIEPTIEKEPVKLDQVLPKGRRTHLQADVEPRVIWDVREDCWRLKHPAVEKFSREIDWEWRDSYIQFNKICKSTGMTEAMRNAGIKDGEEIIAGNHRFAYEPTRIGTESRMLQYEIDLDTTGEVGKDIEDVSKDWYNMNRP